MKAKFAGLVAAGLLGTTCAASAVTITDVEVVPNPYNTLSVNSASPAYSGNPISGLILLTTSGGQTLPVFCVDLFHDIGIGSGQSIPYFSAPVTRDSPGPLPGPAIRSARNKSAQSRRWWTLVTATTCTTRRTWATA